MKNRYYKHIALLLGIAILVSFAPVSAFAEKTGSPYNHASVELDKSLREKIDRFNFRSEINCQDVLTSSTYSASLRQAMKNRVNAKSHASTIKRKANQIMSRFVTKAAINKLPDVPIVAQSATNSVASRINASETYHLNISISDVELLDIPTYDGKHQCVHPSVRYVPGGWAGYEWWMAFTPYPYGLDQYENPSLVASNDGTTWKVPASLINPIDPTPNEGHNCDTELIYDGKNMLVYYVDGIGCHRRTVYPDMSIGAEETCTNFRPVSPAIIRKNENDWIAWYCDLRSLQLYSATSKDGLNWTNTTVAPNDMPDEVSWHISASPVDNGYTFLIAAFSRVKGDNGHTKLHFGYASDPNSIIKTALILSPKEGWTEREIYRSCMIGSKVFISAADMSSEWHIGSGIMESELKSSNLPIWRQLQKAIPSPRKSNLATYENESVLRSYLLKLP